MLERQQAGQQTRATHQQPPQQPGNVLPARKQPVCRQCTMKERTCYQCAQAGSSKSGDASCSKSRRHSIGVFA